MISNSKSVFLLFSYELNKKKKISFSSWNIVNKVILEDKYKKEDNDYIIELYEIKREFKPFFMFGSYIDIKIDNYDLGMKIFQDEIFIFNEKNDLNINCLTIEEEFNLYYEFIKKNKDKDNPKNILNLKESIFRIMNENKKCLTLSLLLTIIIEEDFNKIIGEKIIEKYISFIDKKGNLLKIDKEKLYLKFKNNPLNNYYIMYVILENKDKLRDLVIVKENRRFIFACLFKYKKFFKNYIKIFPDYSFLIDSIDSAKILFDLFQYPKNLSEFIFLLDDKKEHIYKLISERKRIFIQDFFSPKDSIFNEKFNESFYFSLININAYINKERLLIIGFRRESEYFDLIIRCNLFNFFISNEIFDSKYIEKLNEKKNIKLNEYNNMEILGLIYNFFLYKKFDFTIVEELINILNNRKISDDCFNSLKKLNFDKRFIDIKKYKKNFSIFLENVSNIKLMKMLMKLKK